MLTLLPWHRPQWTYIVQARQAGRLAHALLMQGPKGTGKYEFACYMGASLLCNSPDADYCPCGVCKACSLYAAGNHTDIQLIQPEPQGKQIKVDQIRTLIDFISLKSRYAGYKIAIIHPADAMNKSAANTLLKTLEEPPPLSILMLVTHRPEVLPVTIRSRCQHISFRPDYSQLSRSWLYGKINDRNQASRLLELANGAPLAALEIHHDDTIARQEALFDDLERLSKSADDPVRTAKQWNDMGAEPVLRWLLQFVINMIRLYTGNTGKVSQMTVNVDRMQKLTKRLNLYKLMTTYDLLMRNYRLSSGQISYDTQGLLEEFIIYWQQQQESGG